MHSKKLYFIKFFAISFFIFIILNFFIAFIVLKNGVHINSLSLANVTIKQLYLKLDNRLNLTIKELKITPSEKNGTIDWFYLIEAFELFPLLVEFATIKKLQLQTQEFDYTLSFAYKDATFSIDSKDLYLHSKVIKQNGSLYAKPIINFKQMELFIFGDLNFDPLGLKASAKGEFFWHDAKGEIEFTREAKAIDLKLRSDNFANLKDIFDNFGLNPNINAWTYKYIRAKDYKLEYMQFHHRLDEKLDLYNLQAKAVAKDVKVKFHPKVNAVDVEEVELFFKDGKLLFNLKKPTYEGKDLQGSFVYISDLLDSKDDFIVVDIQTKARYDKSIKKILDAYGIDILVKQNSGTVDANVVLNILFKNAKTKATGSFRAKDAEFELFGYKLPAKDANVTLHNNLITFHNIHIKDNLQHFQTKGFIDTGAKKAQLDFNLYNFEKYNLAIADKEFRAAIDFTDDVVIDIPFLNSDITVGKNFSATVKQIEQLSSYIPAIDFTVDSGSIDIFSKDYENFKIDLNAKVQQPYLKEDNKTVKDFDFSAFYNLNEESLKIKAAEKITYNHRQKELKLQDWDLDLTTALNERLLENENGFRLSIQGKDSDLLFKNHRLVIENYTLAIAPKKITLDAREDNTVITFKYEDQNLSLGAKNVQDKTLHPLLNSKAIKNGSYDLTLQGSLENMQGVIKINGGVVSQMKTYNNLIALINTVPALTLFKSPGFNEEGLTVNDGAIEFITYENTVFITKLYINGKAADIVGSGYIDLDTQTVDMDLKIKTVRELGNALSKIPLAGYIVFGEDESVSFNAKITGDLQNPQVQTQTAKDIILTPYNLLKRTIQSPFKLLEDVFSK